MKEIIEYIIMGLIQGIAEPLPISSSGHLILARDLFGSVRTDLNLEIILNFASLIAILIFYRKDIVELVKNSWNYIFKKQLEHKKDFIYALMLVIASVPAGIIGFLFKDLIEDKLANSLTVGVALLVTAVALFAVNKYSKTNRKTDIKMSDAAQIGAFQAIALIPGISRSGATLVGGLSRKVETNAALKFSFLMYIPISVGSFIFTLTDLDVNSINLTAYSLSFIVSLVATLISLKLLYSIVKNSQLHYFSIYCIFAGVFGILLGLGII